MKVTWNQIINKQGINNFYAKQIFINSSHTTQCFDNKMHACSFSFLCDVAGYRTVLSITHVSGLKM